MSDLQSSNLMDTNWGEEPMVGTESLGTTSTADEAVSDTSLEEMREKIEKIDPDMAEFGDELVVEALRRKKMRDLGLKEGQRTPGQMIRNLTPAQKAALFETYHLKTLHGAGNDRPTYIDWSQVPDTIHLHWLSPNVVDKLGIRGYRKVECTPATMRWAPNARQLGSSKFITHANYILCWIDADVKLERDIQNHRKTNEILKDRDERFRSGLASLARGLGIPRERLEKLDRERAGILATRGADPSSPYAPDLTEGEE